MDVTTLAKVLKDDTAVNSAEESLASFIINSNPKFKWNYTQEADRMLNLLKALEYAGVIKVL
jgi:hypothetical protein